MYISESTYKELNAFLADCFQMNSFCDNIAYNLGYVKMTNAEPIFHEKFAHAFPGLADVVSELMLKLEARPVRYGLHEDIVEYNSNVETFAALKARTDEYRSAILKLIDVADINNDVEVKIEMEDFAAKFTTLLNQVNVWNKKAIEYGDAVEKFDHDFETFTVI